MSSCIGTTFSGAQSYDTQLKVLTRGIGQTYLANVI
jgi:hypothetical protein